MLERWQNQEEALQFAIAHPACMLAMDMGTGKTRTAIDIVYARDWTNKILIVCPKAVVGVWRENLKKFAPDDNYSVWDQRTGSVKTKAASMVEFLQNGSGKTFVVINYDSVWRKEMGDAVMKAGFEMVILDESHRAKAAGSKVSKFLALLGKKVTYKLCLTGTPMANSPLDVYGQYRFLEPSIFGTNHYFFLQEYAIMGGPDHNFIVGYKNQQELNRKFKSIAYTCTMEDIKDRIKLPDHLPPMEIPVDLPARDMKTMKQLNGEFISECNGAFVTAGNVLTKMLRLQQITSGFCLVQDNPMEQGFNVDLNTSKEDALADMLSDMSPEASVVVFCVFRHDILAIRRAADKANRECFELSGEADTLDEWKKHTGAVIAVQIQAGSEGVDMTKARYAVYFSIPHSLAMYNQSKARLYRPGQTAAVTFYHLIAKNTIDESMYESLTKKKDIIESIKNGTFNFGFIH